MSFIFFLLIYSGACRRAGNWLKMEALPEHADAIVMLMGSFPDRVLQVHETWEKGLADRILLVEENMGAFAELKERGAGIISNSEQAAASLRALGIPGENITILPGAARSTLDEALVIKEYLNKNRDTDTLLLISSPDHMRRAYLIFSKVLRDRQMPVVIGCQPSRWSSFNGQKWWRRKEDIQSVITEVVKIGSFIFIEKHQIPKSDR